jgi:hypothetical protein
VLSLLTEEDQWWIIADKAETLARYAHEDQFDKAGDPYILHPERVAQAVHHLGPKCVALAWLHDVVEDTSWSLETLSHAGFPRDLLVAVDAITHRPHEPYADYLDRVREDPIARIVKIHDMQDNGRVDRLTRLPEEIAARLRRKYTQGMASLILDDPSLYAL